MPVKYILGPVCKFGEFDDHRGLIQNFKNLAFGRCLFADAPPTICADFALDVSSRTCIFILKRMGRKFGTMSPFRPSGFWIRAHHVFRGVIFTVKIRIGSRLVLLELLNIIQAWEELLKGKSRERKRIKGQYKITHHSLSHVDIMITHFGTLRRRRFTP